VAAGTIFWIPAAPLGAADSAWSFVRQRGFLRVAADPLIGPPYFFRSEDRYAGFEWEILSVLGGELGVRIEVIEVAWPEQLDVLLSQKVDLIFNGHEVPTGLAGTAFAPTRPYYVSSQRLLVGRTRPLPSRLADLAGLRVGVVRSSGGEALVNAYNQRRGPGIQLSGFGRLSTLVERLEGGLLDAAIVDAPLAAWLVRHRPALAEAGRPLLAAPLVGLVRLQDASLRARLDEGITRLVTDGRLRAILARWNLWNELQRQVLSPPRLFGGRVSTGDFSSS